MDDDDYHEFNEEQQSPDKESVKDRVNCKSKKKKWSETDND